MIKLFLHKIRMRLPRGLRALVVRSPVFGSTLRRVDPLRDPSYVWKLSGALEGMRFKVVDPSERQYVTAPYEPAVVAAIQSVVAPGMTCVDAGAHIGYMTLLMTREVGPAGRVFAFEPSPVNCERLRANLAVNAVGNAVVVQAFVSSQDGEARLAPGASSFEHQLDAGQAELDGVASIALDSYFADRGVDFIKLDVEGADELAVEGMRRMLARDKPTILVEDHGAPTAAAKTILASLGYEFTEIDGAHALAVPNG